MNRPPLTEKQIAALRDGIEFQLRALDVDRFPMLREVTENFRQALDDRADLISLLKRIMCTDALRVEDENLDGDAEALLARVSP